MHTYKGIFFEFLIVLIIGFIGLSIWYLFVGVDYGFLRSEITAYRAVCAVNGSLDESCKNKERIEKITFKVYPEEQNVVGDSDSGINSFERCQVVNRKKWDCRVGDRQVGFGKNGFYDTATPKVIGVSKFEWSRLEKFVPASSNQ